MSRILRTQAALFSNRCGSIGIAAAVTLPILLGAMGVALDYITMLNGQRALQDAFDAAAVSTAASMASGKSDKITAKAYAASFIMAELSDRLTAFEIEELRSKLSIDVTPTDTTVKSTYDIQIKGGYTVSLSPFSRLAGFDELPISAGSASRSERSYKLALSMYVVLDRSGSMSFVTDTPDGSKTKCPNYTASTWGYYPYLPSSSPCYLNKVSALKQAAGALFDKLDELEAKDNTDKIIRVGEVSFTDTMQTPESIDWGTSRVRNYLNALPSYPTGGTDMTDGMDLAYQSLKSLSEVTAQATKGNVRFAKFLVLMTDGENTGASATWNPALDAETQNTCNSARAAGITVFTVAFMAPANGEALLKNCATTEANFYVAKDSQSLIAAFADIGEKAAERATRITN